MLIHRATGVLAAAYVVEPDPFDDPFNDISHISIAILFDLRSFDARIVEDQLDQHGKLEGKSSSRADDGFHEIVRLSGEPRTRNLIGNFTGKWLDLAETRCRRDRLVP